MEESKRDLDVEVLEGPPPVVRLRGEVDFHNKERVTEVFDRLVGDGHHCIHADLKELVYMDSSALSALVGCANRAANNSSCIRLVQLSDSVSRLLTLCGAKPFFGRSEVYPAFGDDSTPNGLWEDFWHVSDFELPGVPSSAQIARDRIRTVIEALPINPSDGQDVILAVGEALANAIKHGCKCDPAKRIRVRCVAGHCRLTIDVTDPGNGFDPLGVPAPVPRDLPKGGMGIYLMRQLVDEVSYSFGDSKTTIQLIKFVHCVRELDSYLMGATTNA